SDWQAHYTGADFAALICEAAVFSQGAIAFNQAAACLDRLIDIACLDVGVPDTERIEAARLAGTVEDCIRRNLQSLDQSALDRFEEAFALQLECIRRFAAAPCVSESIISGEFAETRSGGSSRK